jgi:Restriction endonuclease
LKGECEIWLERQGWTVTEAGGAGFPDFVAERDGELMWVETKVRKSAVTREHLNQWVSQLVQAQHEQAIDRFALFVSAPRFAHSALESARQTPGVDISLETGIGEFEAIATSSSR